MSARHLVTTDEAAALVDVPMSRFREWANRRDLKPVGRENRGRTRINVWDVEELYDATRRSPRSWRDNQPKE